MGDHRRRDPAEQVRGGAERATHRGQHEDRGRCCRCRGSDRSGPSRTTVPANRSLPPACGASRNPRKITPRNTISSQIGAATTASTSSETTYPRSLCRSETSLTLLVKGIFKVVTINADEHLRQQTRAPRQRSPPGIGPAGPEADVRAKSTGAPTATGVPAPRDRRRVSDDRQDRDVDGDRPVVRRDRLQQISTGDQRHEQRDDGAPCCANRQRRVRLLLVGSARRRDPSSLDRPSTAPPRRSTDRETSRWGSATSAPA